MTRYWIIGVLMACVLGVGQWVRAEEAPALVPYPKSLEPGEGRLTLTGDSRIIATDPALAPLAEVFADEMRLVTGLDLAAVAGTAGAASAGDIVLAFAPALDAEAHRVTVADHVTVHGGNYVGVAMGTTTVLQALERDGRTVHLPRIVVKDRPGAPYTGMMLDVARKPNSIEVLRQCVVLARLYKMKYFHLHLSDDQLFTFPSTKYPQLKGEYTLEQLKDLVHFADVRGVTIIPELEVPGHSTALRRAMPEVFGEPPLGVINFFNDDALRVLDDLVGEMCAVFESSPYFHIGADESWWGNFEKQPNVIADRERTGRSTADQFAWFLGEMNEMVKKRGKTTIAWEGFHTDNVDEDIIVMAWDGRYFSPPQLIDAGHRIINVPWRPSIYSTARQNYEWNMWLVGSQLRRPDQLERTDPVLGAQQVLWERPGQDALPRLRTKAPPRLERTHSPDAGRTYEDFDRRFAHVDRLLDLLVHHFDVREQGLTNHGDKVFTSAATLTFTPSPAVPGAVIRYDLNDQEVTADSPVYEGPIRLTGSAGVRARLFDGQGEPIGFERRAQYHFVPVIATDDNALDGGSFDKFLHAFSDPFTLQLKSGTSGVIHYTLDGSDPALTSQRYANPLRIEERSTTVRAAVFHDGKRVGDVWERDYTYINYERNLTTGKRAAASRVEAAYLPAYAVDGRVDLGQYWAANPYPQSLTIDLGSAHRLDGVHLFPYWDGGRSYQYTVELSIDGDEWTQVVDNSGNTAPSTPAGTVHAFDARDARYVRVNMLKNSANRGVHLVEVRVSEAATR